MTTMQMRYLLAGVRRLQRSILEMSLTRFLRSFLNVMIMVMSLELKDLFLLLKEFGFTLTLLLVNMKSEKVQLMSQAVYV
jgi:hypothetical protein